PYAKEEGFAAAVGVRSDNGHGLWVGVRAGLDPNTTLDAVLCDTIDITTVGSLDGQTSLGKSSTIGREQGTVVVRFPHNHFAAEASGNLFLLEGATGSNFSDSILVDLSNPAVDPSNPAGDSLLTIKILSDPGTEVTGIHLD